MSESILFNSSLAGSEYPFTTYHLSTLIQPVSYSPHDSIRYPILLASSVQQHHHAQKATYQQTSST
jgi:hypothetical protein